MKTIALIMILLTAVLISCTNLTLTPAPTSTVTLSPTLISTSTPIAAPTLTATPLPQVGLESFMFPFNVPQVIQVWNKLPKTNKSFTYHIVDRRDRNDACGYHPGDVIIAISSGVEAKNFSIDVFMPYPGRVVQSWKDIWQGDCYSFQIGQVGGVPYYLDSYHTDNNTGQLPLETMVTQGTSYAIFNRTNNPGGSNEAKVHLTLYAGDKISDPKNEFLAPGAINISQYALPATLEAMYQNQVPLLIIYEGENYCNMTPQQKVDTIINTVLPNAGFCVTGDNVTYCGKNNNLTSLRFRLQSGFDNRSVLLTPIK